MGRNILERIVWTPSGHTDDRRKIVDVNPKIKFFTIADVEGLELGHHYHALTNECFYIVKGDVLIKLENINTKEKGEYSLKPGEQIQIPPYFAHLVLPQKNAMFMGILEKDFNKDDLNPYKITW